MSMVMEKVGVVNLLSALHWIGYVGNYRLDDCSYYQRLVYIQQTSFSALSPAYSILTQREAQVQKQRQIEQITMSLALVRGLEITSTAPEQRIYQISPFQSCTPR